MTHDCQLLDPPNDETEKGYRRFSTGATRDTAIGKMDVARYLHPAVLWVYSRYMRAKQTMADGSTRPGDNWQKGIPPQELLSSLQRHNLDLWLHLKDAGHLAEEEIEEALCGILFNAMALLLHEQKGTLVSGSPQHHVDGAQAGVGHE